MKKVISVLIVLVMLMSVAPSALASSLDGLSDYPVIIIGGNGEEIYDSDGNMVYDFSPEADDIKEIAKEVIPYFLMGMASGDYSTYYEKFAESISELYDRAQLDENGDPKYGTNVSQSKLDLNEMAMTYDYSNGTGKFNFPDYRYQFYYDWRLSPFEKAERLNEYIDGVLKATGKSKVSVLAKCLGGDVIIAYLEQFGADKIDSVVLDAVATNGSEKFDNVILGNVKLDGAAASRMLSEKFGDDMFGESFKTVYMFLIDTLKLANVTGVTDEVTGFLNSELIEKFAPGLLSAYCRASYCTWPSYWTMVRPENFEKAKKLVFGEKGSEKYTKYSGLISKIDNYNSRVGSRVDEVLLEAKASGVNVAVISKYGYQLDFYCGESEKISDRWISLGYASFGATTSDITTTLTDKYIKDRVDNGYGEYISPDKKVDASTCILPETTWFLKGVVHDNWSDGEYALALKFFASNGEMTVNTYEEYPRYLVCDVNTDKDVIFPMTEDNCDVDDFEIAPKPQTKSEILVARLKALFTWLTSLINLIVDKLF